MIDISKISPPKTIDELKKKMGCGRYKNNKSSIIKKLQRKGDLTTNPPFSFRVDYTTKKLILTYTSIQPKREDSGGYIRNDYTNEIEMYKVNKEKYLGDYTFPLNKKSFYSLVSDVIQLQKDIREKNNKILNQFNQQSQMIETYVEEFLTKKKYDVSSSTIREYENILGYFLLFLKRNSNKDYLIFNKHQLERIKQTNPKIVGYLDTDFTTKLGVDDFEGNEGRILILNFINQIQKPSTERIYGGLNFKQSKPTTIKSYFIVIRVFFNWMFRNGYLNVNPIWKISSSDLPKFSQYDRIVRKKLTPTDYDIDLIWKWIMNERDNPPMVGRWDGVERKCFSWFLPMLVIFYKCGIRNSTNCNLELKNIDWERGVVKYETKGGVYGELYLDDELKEWLKPLIINEETNKKFTDRKYLFSSKNGKPYPSNTVSHYFKNICREIKSQNESFNENLTIHSFRRYYINKCLREGLPLSLIRKSINHSDYKTIMKYETDTFGKDELQKSTLPIPSSVSTSTKEDELSNIHKQIELLKEEEKKLLNQFG